MIFCQRRRLAYQKKGVGYNIIVETVKGIEELSDNTPNEIRNLIIRSVDILDDRNFKSLVPAILGYESYEEAMNMNVDCTGGIKAWMQFKGGYHELLDDAPNLSNSRFAGRLMACAMNIIAKKGNDEIEEQATRALLESFDNYIQMAYDIANEEERDLIRKLRFLAKALNRDDVNGNEFVLGKMEGQLICNDAPWDLLYEDGDEYEILPYSEGRAAVRKGNFWGYIDEDGRLMTKALGSEYRPGLPFSYAESFCDGWAVVHDAGAQDEYDYLIDRNCEPMMVEGEYISSGDSMRNGISIVGFDYWEDHRVCFVDKECHVLTERFEEISYIGNNGMPYSDFGNYAMVRNGYEYGLLNVKSFKLELPCKYGWTDFWQTIERLEIVFG